MEQAEARRKGGGAEPGADHGLYRADRPAWRINSMTSIKGMPISVI
jgi:hypothetical protein